MKMLRPPVRRSPGARTKAQAEAARPSAGARGYGADWRKLRAAQPRTPCVEPGCGAPWRHDHHLDHVVPRARGGTDDPSNLAWRCASCHSKKTAGSDGGFGNPPRGPSDLRGGGPNDRVGARFVKARN